MWVYPLSILHTLFDFDGVTNYFKPLGNRHVLNQEKNLSEKKKSLQGEHETTITNP